jgi:hypothetical protein
MATIAFKQPNGLYAMFQTTASQFVAHNLTKEKFITEYVKLYTENTRYPESIDKATNDAVETITKHVHPWDDIDNYYIECYARTDDEYNEWFNNFEKECSEPIKE